MIRLKGFSQKLRAKEIRTSEWITRKIINRLNRGEGATFSEIDKVVWDIRRTITAKQASKNPGFYFSLISHKLYDWLQSEAKTGKTEMFCDGDEPRYKLSNRMKTLLQRKRKEINKLISEMTGNVY